LIPWLIYLKTGYLVKVVGKTWAQHGQESSRMTLTGGDHLFLLLTNKLVILLILDKSENTLRYNIFISKFYGLKGRFLKLTMTLDKKFSLVLAPTGMVPTKSMSPHVPITPEEII
jgi:hypothetical protein